MNTPHESFWKVLFKTIIYNNGMFRNSLSQVFQMHETHDPTGPLEYLQSFVISQIHAKFKDIGGKTAICYIYKIKL